MKTLGVNWISLVPFAYCQAPNFSIDLDRFQNWKALTANGIRHTIQQAQKLGISVLIKPQLYVRNSWPGEIDFNNNSDWKNWESEYLNFIDFYLDIAITENVDMFCVGTELSASQLKRPVFWEELLKYCRNNFQGKIIYSANWDQYLKFEWWSLCDYISISSYFPINSSENPKIEDLITSWSAIQKQLMRFSIKKGKPLLFTEYGYHSVVGTAFQHWIIEDNIKNIAISELAQANALEALYTCFWNEPYWHGGFLWKWYPQHLVEKINIQKDYSPQDKKAMAIIKKWFNLSP